MMNSWNINYKKHKLLKCLTKHYILYWQKSVGLEKDYLTFTELRKKLKWNLTQLEIIYIGLEKEGELEQKVDNINNYLKIKEKGITSYTDNKYIDRFWKGAFSYSKDLAGIVIPLLSLVIAYKAIAYKVESHSQSQEKSLISIEKKLKQIEKQIDRLKPTEVDNRKDSISIP